MSEESIFEEYGERFLSKLDTIPCTLEDYLAGLKEIMELLRERIACVEIELEQGSDHGEENGQ